ncbi:F-box only protein 6 isoform X1 [Anolis carolinensis]|uniref:F-box only protein 6 isoform X1 n=1 Tax=Anolis carolinensis TaxID=28377 RepID=UPI002F2B4810
MANVCDLPEDVLIEILIRIPARELIRNCRPVCPLWRDLVDLPSLWKRKCQRDGYHARNPEKTPPDWKIHYFLCSLERNLIKNPCAEDGFSRWSIDENGGDEWKIEAIPGAHGRGFPHPHVQKYFVTSFYSCIKSQMITLKKEGYWDELMDEVRPDIVVKDWPRTLSMTTLRACATSSSATEAATRSSGPGGTGSVSPTPASPSAPMWPRDAPRPARTSYLLLQNARNQQQREKHQRKERKASEDYLISGGNPTDVNKVTYK